MQRILKIAAVALLLGACDEDATNPDPAADGLRFSGSHSFTASGSPNADLATILNNAFAVAESDSLSGLVAVGYAPAAQGGELLILQLPRETGTYACGNSAPCHGRLLTGVELEGVGEGEPALSVTQRYEVQSGSITVSELGSTMRGSFSLQLRAVDDGAVITVTNGTISVPYTNSRIPGGPIACLVAIAAGHMSSCNT